MDFLKRWHLHQRWHLHPLTSESWLQSYHLEQRRTTSSRLVIHQFKFRSPRQLSINLWKVAGALVASRDILLHSKKPRGPIVKAVYCLLSSSISTFQYPDFKSRDEKVQDPSSLSKVSSILGKLYASFTVLKLSFLRSMQNLNSLFFFLTNTTALHQGLSDGLMCPMSNISWRCFLTASYWLGIILLYLFLKEVRSVTLILYFTLSVFTDTDFREDHVKLLN